MEKITTIYETVAQEQQNIIINNIVDTVTGTEVTLNETNENTPLSTDIIKFDKLNKKVSVNVNHV